MNERSFFPALLRATGPFLVWAAHFGAVYGLNGLACARGLDGARVLGAPLVTLGVLGATGAALLALGWLAARELGPRDPREGEAADFLGWFALASALAAAVAVLWVGLPVLQVPACG